jgi:hypothetical protein
MSRCAASLKRSMLCLSPGRTSTGLVFFKHLLDSAFQQVEIKPTSIADDLSQRFVNRGQLLADVSQKFLLLTRPSYLLRFSHQIPDHGILSARRHKRLRLVFKKNKRAPSRAALLLNGHNRRDPVGADVLSVAERHKDSILDAHRKGFGPGQRLGRLQLGSQSPSQCAHILDV